MRCGSLTVLLVVLVTTAAPARGAALRPVERRPIPIVFNQGVAEDPSTRTLFFSGATSDETSGLVRTDPRLRPTGARPTVLPRTREGFNHIGDLGFDPLRRRLLLALECYRPRGGGNTCRRGAIAVADPRTLAVRHVVRLDPGQVSKAMWVEASPDGRWLWTSSGPRLLAYPAAAVSAMVATRQRQGTAGALRGRDAGVQLPTPSVTGAAALPAPGSSPGRAYRLALSLNRGPRSQIVSYEVRHRPDGSPVVASLPRLEVSLPRVAGEPEGVTALNGGQRLGWQLLSRADLSARLVSYAWPR